MTTRPPVDDPRLETALEAAERAAAIQREGLAEETAYEYKGRYDIVTEVDVESERVIIDHIEDRHPDDAIRAEESGDRGTSDRRWIVDPIDGTTNFHHGLPVFTVSIAFERAGEPEIGVIHHPTTGEVFAAVQGEGAYLDGAPLSVSDVSSLDESLVSTGFGPNVSADDPRFDTFGAVAERTHGVRRFGSAAYELSLVAAGRLEAFYHHEIADWDVAAGVVLVAEAGGRTTPLDAYRAGETDTFVATNGAVHEALSALLV